MPAFLFFLFFVLFCLFVCLFGFVVVVVVVVIVLACCYRRSNCTDGSLLSSIIMPSRRGFWSLL